MVDFGGWEMPIAYPEGTIAEHRRCRSASALFDVSHLGTVRVEGPGAFEVLQQTVTNDLTKISPGRAQYTHVLAEDGSVLDDMIIWWVAEDCFDVMPNASNTERVRAVLPGIDVTEQRAVLAIQGPSARGVLATICPEAAEVGRFKVTRVRWHGATIMVAGTGYTGEDGVECAIPTELAKPFFDALRAAGATPAGLGARDTLRLEAGLPLHGHELGPGITPLQAGLSWVVAFDKGPFIGRQALLAERAGGVPRLLQGLVTQGRQPPREGSSICKGDAVVGRVTSGNFSPTLEVGIALGFIDTDAGVRLGDSLSIEVRGRSLAAQLHELPFVAAPKGRG